MTPRKCPYGHTIKTSQDRVQGMCRTCRRERDRRRLSDLRAARLVVQTTESLGVEVRYGSTSFTWDEWVNFVTQSNKGV